MSIQFENINTTADHTTQAGQALLGRCLPVCPRRPNQMSHGVQKKGKGNAKSIDHHPRRPRDILLPWLVAGFKKKNENTTLKLERRKSLGLGHNYRAVAQRMAAPWRLCASWKEEEDRPPGCRRNMAHGCAAPVACRVCSVST